MAQHYDSRAESSHQRPQSYQQPMSGDYAQAHYRPGASSQLHVDEDIPPKPTQPINDAVNSALNTHEASSKVDPDLVAQITEQVINSLKLGGLSSTSSPPLSQVGSNSIPYSQSGQANATSYPDYMEDSAVRSHSPPSHNSRQMDGHVEERMHNQRSPERRTSPPTELNHGQDNTRPKGPPRDPTDDTTTLEKIWQPLFGADGTPTARLGQFLQGLAIHIIEDFEPKRSIVIPPQKMLKFYETVKVSDEIFQWNSIFGGKMTNSSLSHLYRDLKCQHHFVQYQVDDKPNVPALTPAGFETWMIHIIRANPDTEYLRFAKAVLHMPISNADNAKERFPKELTRRLFPKQSNIEIRMDLEDAILADPVIELTAHGLAQRQSAGSPSLQPLPGAPGTTVPPHGLPQVPQSNHSGSPKPHPPPLQKPPVAAQIPPPPPPVQQMPPQERARQQYSSSSFDAAVDDTIPPVSIERERKPYHAQPGGGKQYSQEDPRVANSEYSPHGRSYSTATSSRPVIDPAEDYAVNPRVRTGSIASGPSQRQRYRSPSPIHPQNPYSRSDADVPPTVYGANAPNLHTNYDDDGLSRSYSRPEYPRRYRNDEPVRDHGANLPPPPPPPPHLHRNDYEEDYYSRRPSGSSQHHQPPRY